jgi:LemA protein
VQGYTAHERGTLEAVVAARSHAMNLSDGAGPARRAEAENQLTQALGRLIAIAEAYTHLKADHNFAALHVELTNTEDKIAYARQFFTSAVQSYNNAVQTVPTNLIAGLGGFRAREFFQAAGEERGPVQVGF